MPQEYSMTTLFDAATIAQRVKALGATITKDFQGESVLVVGVMKGSLIFLADLVREISLDLKLDFIGVSSYQGMHSSGEVRLTHDLSQSIEGLNVLLVEDIVDTGTTLDFLIENFKLRKPKKLSICALLSKPDCHSMKNNLDYVGFEISKEFVVGYGLDVDGRFRQLPSIMQVHTSA